VLIGCDVDPELPHLLSEPPRDDIWAPLDLIPSLVEALGDALPPITWLIRSDETVRHATGEYASGYTSRREMWSSLAARGHELGWHMHLLGRDESSGTFVFDPRPTWLPEAHAALARHFPIVSTRTGWDYGSDFLFRTLDELGVEIDFSALPGHRAWYRFGATTVHVDWLRCPEHSYRPARDSYQRPGGEDALDLIEVPVARFPIRPLAMVRRFVWRVLHGCVSLRGLGRTTKTIATRWDGLPVSRNDVWVFYFHPEDLTPEGIGNMRENVERLRRLPGLEFVTAGAVRRRYGETGLR
jgi:hypothetical protein